MGRRRRWQPIFDAVACRKLENHDIGLQSPLAMDAKKSD
jgi:hypothetical protein